MMVVVVFAEEPPRENVTARSQVRDDGQAGAPRGGRSEASGGGIFCGLDIYYQEARGWSAAWLWSRCGVALA
jgi:hypothetical protein